MRLPRRPTIYEINVAVWLSELGTDLAGVPPEAWNELAALKVDAVWLMGVWQRSPAGRLIASSSAEVEDGNHAALPDLRPDDVIGSPYCVRDYAVDERFGGPEALAVAREQLAARGVGVILDFVPNHVAPDHPWVAAHPEHFIRGSAQDLAASPEEFIQTAGGAVAKGRDPNLPPWPDVVQLDAFSAGLRHAVVDTLRTIADQCDGVRCDMAMLVTNAVFERTWGERAGTAPEAEYWPTIITATRATRPDFTFMAEAYWDTEYALQQHGFDLCYDKRLYDQLAQGTAESVREHLLADPGYQQRLVRFIENHDEARAATVFPPGRARAAAVVMSTLEGARLYHHGQLDGARTQLPVFLGRRRGEVVDAELRAFYGTLIRAVADAQLRDGVWQLCDCTGWPENESHRQLLAWTWTANDRRTLIVVNFADAPAQGRVRLHWDDLAERAWGLDDALSGDRFERGGAELRDEGLYVELGAWGTYLLAFKAQSAVSPQ